MTTASTHEDRPIDTRLKISALWIATMMIFVYVDLFSLYRPDVRADIDAGKVFAFDINQIFLFFVTLYVVIPSLMIYLTLVMRRRTNRIVNIVVAGIYAVTIVGSAIGEWNYFIFGSVIEAALLVLVIGHEYCGAVKGAIDKVSLGNLTGLLKKITPAVDACQHYTGTKTSKDADFVDLVIRENIKLTVVNIRKQSPILKEMEEAGEIKIVGAYYDMDNGEVTFFE